jgi:UDP-N-acetylglucosamine:LPS N-acetylglucosamine transferase
LKPTDVKDKKIVISVLNWGFGHVSRSIGLISQLKGQGNEVVFAGDEQQAAIIKQYFPELKIIAHEGYSFNFRGKGRFAVDLFLSLPRLVKQFSKEKNRAEEIVKEEGADLLISDHRYGFRSDMVPSIFVTHQLQLPIEWYQSAMQLWHKNLINRFKTVWVMDTKESKLAGKLSATSGYNKVIYIGPYSRFMGKALKEDRDIDTVLIASGPDVYAQQLVDLYAKPGVTVVCADSIQTPPGVQRFSGNWLKQDELIRSANKIISRSGYSTIMDAQFLDASFKIIPTPGQREQEYLSSLTQ